MMSASDPVVVAALGGIVGMALALTGAGGGIVAMPLLTVGLGLSVAAAGPVALIAVGAAAAIGAVLGLIEHSVRYRAALFVGAVGMALAPFGHAVARRLPEGLLTALLAIVMGWAAWAMYRRSLPPTPRPPDIEARHVPCRCSAQTGRFVWTPACATALGGIGSAAGLLSGLLGVGGGFVIVPALSRFSDLASYSVVCTSQAVIALVSLSTVASAAAFGHLEWAVASPFAGGAIAALLIGRGYAKRWSGPRLQRGFALLSATLAAGVLAHGIWTAMK